MEARPWHRHYDPGVPTTLEYPAITLTDLLTDTAARHPDKPRASLSSAAPSASGSSTPLFDRLAAALQEMGIVKGDRVSVYVPNCPQTVIAYEPFGRRGVAVAATPCTPAEEFAHQTADAGSRVAFCLTLNYPGCARLVPVPRWSTSS